MNCTAATGILEASTPGPSRVAQRTAAEPSRSFGAILGEHTLAAEQPICLAPREDTGIDPASRESDRRDSPASGRTAKDARSTKAARKEEREDSDRAESNSPSNVAAIPPTPSPEPRQSGSTSLYTQEATSASGTPESIQSQTVSPARPTPQIETAGPGPTEESAETATPATQEPTAATPEHGLDGTPQPVRGFAVSTGKERAVALNAFDVDGPLVEPRLVNSAAQWDRMLSDAEAFAAPQKTAESPAEAPHNTVQAPVQTETVPAQSSQMVTALDGVLTMANEQTVAAETKRTQAAGHTEREREEMPATQATQQEPASVVAPAAARAQHVDAPARAEIVRMAPGVEMTQRIEALHTAQAAARPSVQSFTVPIGQETNPVAMLRLVQMGTGVRMTVQTTDAALSQSMQAHLPQLVHGLEESGFRANFQARTESTATMVPASTASSESRQMDSSDSGGARHEGPAHGQSRERRQPSHEWRQWLQHGRKQNKEGN